MTAAVAFDLPDMSCGHCVAAVVKAVAAVDPAAQVEADLPARRIRIAGGQLDPARLRDALAAAGYPPQPARAG
jgi:copper chaperone CopZ